MLIHCKTTDAYISTVVPLDLFYMYVEGRARTLYRSNSASTSTCKLGNLPKIGATLNANPQSVHHDEQTFSCMIQLMLQT